MSLLEITELSHGFGEHILFNHTELTIHKGEHIGLVGKNGAGKSTLIKLCTGELVPDKGRVTCLPSVKIGFLSQYAEMDKAQNIRTFLKTAFQSLYEDENQMNRLYLKAAAGDERALEQAAVYQNRLEQSGFYHIETRIDKVAEGMGLTAIGLDHAVSHLSGGQRAKVILAKLLLEEPDLLILDEPTNFLDKEHVAWLAAYLSQFKGAFLVVSHDADFLEKAVESICDINQQKIRKYQGTYTAFLEKKKKQRENYIRQYNAQQKEIEKTEAFIRKNRAGRKSKMARGRQKQLDRLERLDAPETTTCQPQFHLAALPFTGTQLLTVNNLAVGYEFPVLEHLDFCLKGGEKVVITGFNGIGKSTLFKTLMGELVPCEGSFRFFELLRIGYFEQDLIWEEPEKTPFDIVSGHFPQKDTRTVRRALAQCGLGSRQVMQPIKTLSGGEQAKVKICLLTMTPHHLLMLDEPTNHLDQLAKVALEQALNAFKGTVLLISHEKAFYQNVADRIITLGTK